MPGKAENKLTKKRVTIADIARRAGVSPATVSVTLADRRNISIPEATRDHVKRCAGALGYIPSRLGAGFLRGRSKLVGVLIMTDSYIPFLNCIEGVQEELAARDYVPLVVTANWLAGYNKAHYASGRELVRELPGLRRLLEYQVEGIIYFSMDASHPAGCLEELVHQKIPTVVLGGVDAQYGSVDIVGGDNEAIGRLAADHLLSAGCSSFMFGMPAFHHPLDQIVRSSFIARLEAAGYDCGNFTADKNEPDGLARLLSSVAGQTPAGFFSVRDDLAASALRAALLRGWRVPRDLAVAVMGKTTFSELNVLPITTVDRNSFAAGTTAARLLVQRIEGLSGPQKRILIPPSLKIHASSVSDVSWRLTKA